MTQRLNQFCLHVRYQDGRNEKIYFRSSRRSLSERVRCIISSIDYEDIFFYTVFMI